MHASVRLFLHQVALVLAVMLVSVWTLAAVPSPGTNAPATPMPTRILVKPKAGRSLSALHQNTGAQILRRFPTMDGLEIISPPTSASLDSLLAAYRQSDLVEYAEPDHLVHAMLDPNDTH